MMKKRLLSLLLCLCLIPALSLSLIERPMYEIFVASFYDSDGDGMGDLQGIIQKLDYIESLSVGGLWLMPISPSPSYHKYDVTDYKAIASEYGTMEDFATLAGACHERGLIVILDFVINHTSSQHPWFLSATKSLAIPPCGKDVCPYQEGCKAHNPYVDYYLFSQDGGQADVPGVPGWKYVASFGGHMPDLNLSNPQVFKEIEDIASFWLSHGADGFRLDAVIHYFEQNTKENTQFLTKFCDMVKKHKPDAYIVAEAWSDDNTILSLYESGLDSMFYFQGAGPTGEIVKAIREKNGTGYAKKLAAFDEKLVAAAAGAQNAPFLSNHDMARIAGTLARKQDKMKLAAALYLWQPGVPFVYYGEEIGMSGSGRDENKRLPMLWNVEGLGHTLPPKDADQEQRLKEGVDIQDADPTSLLNTYRSLLLSRSALPEMVNGRLTYLDVGEKAVAAYQVANDKESCVVMHNLGDQTLTLDIGLMGGLYCSSDAGNGAPVLDGTRLTMPPASSCILR
jgi:alpha-amylase